MNPAQIDPGLNLLFLAQFDTIVLLADFSHGSSSLLLTHFDPFGVVQTSYLIHIYLLAMAISGITRCYGNLVAMAAVACIYDLAMTLVEIIVIT